MDGYAETGKVQGGQTVMEASVALDMHKTDVGVMAEGQGAGQRPICI